MGSFAEKLGLSLIDFGMKCLSISQITGLRDRPTNRLRLEAVGMDGDLTNTCGAE
jgi:hypothetical protein